jgi:hypothetical protein
MSRIRNTATEKITYFCHFYQVLTYSVFKMAIKEHEKKDSRPWPGGRIGMFTLESGPVIKSLIP